MNFYFINEIKMENIFFRCMIFLCSSVLFAEMHYPHPTSRFYLGSGFNPFDPDKAQLRCLEWDGIASSSGDRLQRSSIEISGVSSMRELHSKIGFSAYFEGRLFFTKLAASVAYNSEYDFAESNLNWLVSLNMDYGTYSLSNPRLKKEFSQMTPIEIRRRCGHEFVVEEKRGVQVFALLSVKNVEEKQKKELETKLSIISRGFFYDASFEASYKDFMSKARSLGEISIKIFAQGGKGIREFESLLRVDQFMDFSRILESFNGYIKSTNSSEAVPLLYATSSLGNFLEGDFPIPRLNKDILSGLYYRYLEMQKISKRAKQALSQLSFNKEEYEKSFFTLEAYKEELRERGENCLDESKIEGCFLGDREPFTQSENTLRQILCESFRQQALKKKALDEMSYRMMKRRDLYPDFSEKGWEQEPRYRACEEIPILGG
jgi:hypothetical protein